MTRSQFKQLSQFDRDRIESLRRYGTKRGEIAKILGRDKGTISREIARHSNKHGNYRAKQAQTKAEANRFGSKVVGMKIESNKELKKNIIKGLIELRSPDEIAGRMKKDKLETTVGTNAIYKWLYSEYGKPYCQYLCSKKVRKLSQSRLSKKPMIPNRISLRERPEGENHIHGESDLFVSPTRLNVKTVGHLTVIPKVKLLTGTLLPSKSASVMVDSMKKIQKKVGVTTWTMDNGIENIRHEQFGLPTYFCTPGSPWQKPHIEGSIGLIRRWFLPKGTDLSKVDEKTFQSMLFVMNDKHRKSLGYCSSYEKSIDGDIIKKIPKLSKKRAVAFR